MAAPASAQAWGLGLGGRARAAGRVVKTKKKQENYLIVSCSVCNRLRPRRGSTHPQRWVDTLNTCSVLFRGPYQCWGSITGAVKQREPPLRRHSLGILLQLVFTMAISTIRNSASNIWRAMQPIKHLLFPPLARQFQCRDFHTTQPTSRRSSKIMQAYLPLAHSSKTQACWFAASHKCCTNSELVSFRVLQLLEDTPIANHISQG